MTKICPKKGSNSNISARITLTECIIYLKRAVLKMVLHLKIQMISHFGCSCCAGGVGCRGAEGDLTVAVLKVQLIADRKCQNFTYTGTFFFGAQLREKRKCFCFCKSVIKVKVWLLRGKKCHWHHNIIINKNSPQ